MALSNRHRLSLLVAILIFLFVNWKVLRSRSNFSLPFHRDSSGSKPDSLKTKGNLLLQWDLPEVSNLKVMRPEDTVRFQIEKPSSLDWQNMLPKNGGIVSLPKVTGNDQKYSITMFHQLHCLDVLREAIYDTDITEFPEIAHHCINYLRQMALCQARLPLESIRKGIPPKITDLNRSVYVCRDWTKVYEALGENV